MAKILDIDLGWNQIKDDLKSLDNSYTKVGVHQGQIHKSEDGELSDMVIIAAANELGTKPRVVGGSSRSGGQILAGGIPSRPFMRNAFDGNKESIKMAQSKLYNDVITGVRPVRNALSTLGEFLTAKVKLSIKQLKVPPNAPSTIAKKKSSNPLIDQGQLIQSITHTEFIT